VIPPPAGRSWWGRLPLLGKIGLISAAVAVTCCWGGVITLIATTDRPGNSAANPASPTTPAAIDHGIASSTPTAPPSTEAPPRTTPAPARATASPRPTTPGPAGTTQRPTTSAPKPTTKPPAPPTDPRFDTCKAAKAAGYGPYRRGVDPEYEWYRDTGGVKGVVCE
jgi:hypothetical protein